MANPFWKSTRILFRYKRLMAIAFVGALISAACFGAGLTMILPTLKIFFSESDSVVQQRQFARDLMDEQNPPNVRETGQWLLDRVEESKRPPLQQLVEERFLQPDHEPWRQDMGQWILKQVPSDPFRSFAMILGVIGMLTVVGSLGRYMHVVLTLKVINRCAMMWRAQMMRRLLHAPMIAIHTNGSGDYISRLLSDTAGLAGGYRAVMAKTAAEVLKGIFALGAALLINWRLTAIALVGFIPIGVLVRKFGKHVRRASRNAMSTAGQMLRHLKESLDAAEVVKVHDAEGRERRRFAQLNRLKYQEDMKVCRINAMSGPLIETIALFGVIGIALIAGWAIFRHGEDPTEFFMVLIMLAAAGRSLKMIGNLNNTIASAGAAAERVFEVIDLKEEPIGLAARRDLPQLPQHEKTVHFDQVSYAYPGQDHPAVNDVNLNVPFGHTVAIVGGNGSGKSTLLNMLPRLFDPAVGRVLIDGVDIRNVNLRSLRSQIAMVTQRSVLFHGSIAQNIAYGRNWYDRESIVAAAKSAHAHEFITRLPQGYDTPLGESGTGLSGGQRQRLCIARAILRDPSILILDEATSQIDTESEARINQAMRALRHSRTIFVIAHRLSTVIDADLIVVMADGVVVDQGKHDALLERCDIYQSLTRNQFANDTGASRGGANDQHG